MISNFNLILHALLAACGCLSQCVCMCACMCVCCIPIYMCVRIAALVCVVLPLYAYFAAQQKIQNAAKAYRLRYAPYTRLPLPSPPPTLANNKMRQILYDDAIVESSSCVFVVVSECRALSAATAQTRVWYSVVNSTRTARPPLQFNMFVREITTL